MLPPELFPRSRLPPNAAWKCNRGRADNWHGPILRCIGRSLHSTSTEFHRHKIDEERDEQSRAQGHYRKIFVRDYAERTNFPANGCHRSTFPVRPDPETAANPPGARKCKRSI